MAFSKSIFSIFLSFLVNFSNFPPIFGQNLPQGGPCALVEYGGESLCIPFKEINRAFSEARAKVNLLGPFPRDLDLKKFHNFAAIDQLGHALTETTRTLAIKYDLDHDGIRRLLPKLDLHFTEIWDFCPVHFRRKTCSESSYRSLSGHCNNMMHPDWGATLTPFQNFLPPHRPDGVSAGRDEGVDLPNPRHVSSLIHKDAILHTHAITIMLIAWGQIIDHDITLTGDTKDLKTFKEPECCNSPHKEQHHNCRPILIPHDDPFYSHYGVNCMNFARSLAGVRSECRLGPRVAFNSISSFLDASFVYGSSPEFGKSLREHSGGLLRSYQAFPDYELKDLLPLKVYEPDDGCIRPNPNVFCFDAGDVRVNEQLILSVLHTIFMREHNRIARALGQMNGHWNDEKIFQETRRIVIAIVQQITYEEFLPMVLGRDIMQGYGINLQEEGYWDGYDAKVNPSAAEEFITSAFRFGHSLLPSKIERWTRKHRYIGSENLSSLIRQPYHLFRAGYVDNFIAGLVNQLAQAMDEGVTEEVTTLLFKEPHQHFGMDLAAMNIQRGREHSVPGYGHYRKLCGLRPVYDWEDLVGVMRNETIYRYKSLYSFPGEIDLWSAGVSEIHEPGSLLGPTFACLVAMQFQKLRFGDRFWFELPNRKSSFTPEQLREIRHMKLSRLLCDNSDHIYDIQMYAMVLADPQKNPRVNCKSRIIPHLDLEHWRDLTPTTYFEPNLQQDDFHSHEVEYKNPHAPPDVPLNVPSLEPPSQFHKIPNHMPYYPQTPSNELDSHKNHLSFDSFNKVPSAPPPSLHSAPSYYKGEYDDLPADPLHHTSHNSKNPNEKAIIVIAPTILQVPQGHQQYHHSGRNSYKPHIQSLLQNILPGKKGRRLHPFPQSPIPGLDGIYSPNPGYLVRQKFRIPHWHRLLRG